MPWVLMHIKLNDYFGMSLLRTTAILIGIAFVVGFSIGYFL